MNTREVVERYYETVNAGDRERWLRVFDEHLVVDEQLAPASGPAVHPAAPESSRP